MLTGGLVGHYGVGDLLAALSARQQGAEQAEHRANAGKWTEEYA